MTTFSFLTSEPQLITHGDRHLLLSRVSPMYARLTGATKDGKELPLPAPKKRPGVTQLAEEGAKVEEPVVEEPGYTLITTAGAALTPPVPFRGAFTLTLGESYELRFGNVVVLTLTGVNSVAWYTATGTTDLEPSMSLEEQTALASMRISSLSSKTYILTGVKMDRSEVLPMPKGCTMVTTSGSPIPEHPVNDQFILTYGDSYTLKYKGVDWMTLTGTRTLTWTVAGEVEGYEDVE